MKSGEDKRVKYIIDYKEQLVELFPWIHEREMGKILKNMSVIVAAYLGKGMKGLKIFPHMYKNNEEKYTNKIIISKTTSKYGEVRMGFKYKAELARRVRYAREAKINILTLAVRAPKIVEDSDSKTVKNL